MRKRTVFTLLAGALLTGAAACGDDGDDDASTATTDPSMEGAMCSYSPDGGPFGPFGDVCTAEDGDSACITCTRANCCTQAEACAQDETNCSCLLDCFLAECDSVGCLADCQRSEPVDALIECVTDNCAETCI